MRIAAIDPGITGAIALLAEQARVWDMPAVGGTRRIVNGALLADILSEAAPDLLVIEQVAARPGQGVVSMFNFGFSAGLATGVAQGLKIPTKTVTPAQWKRHFGLTGKDKDDARRKALEMFPGLSDNLKRKMDVGRADALLIAAFAMQTETR